MQLMEVVGRLTQLQWSLERGKSLFTDKGQFQKPTLLPGTHPLLQRLPSHPVLHSYHSLQQNQGLNPQALPASSAASRAFEQQTLSAASCRGNKEFLLYLPNSAGIPLCQFFSSSPGAVDTAWLLCIFFRLSRAEELARVGAVEAGIGPGEVTPNISGLDTGITSAAVLGTASKGNSKISGATIGCEEQTHSRASQEAEELHLQPWTTSPNTTRHEIFSARRHQEHPQTERDPTPPHSWPLLTSFILQDTVEPLQHCLLLCIQVL